MRSPRGLALPRHLDPIAIAVRDSERNLEFVLRSGAGDRAILRLRYAECVRWGG